MKKDEVFASIFIAIGTALLGALLSFILTWDYAKEHPTLVYVSFNVEEEIIPEEEWKYKMLPAKYSKYITDLCEQLNFDSDIAVAHLLVENPKLDPTAEHRNSNGTFDQGLFQLNSRSIDTVFINAYWPFSDLEFNPYNWKMNTYVAILHLKDLNNTFKIQADAICAYNCGTGNVMKDTIPDSTYSYLAAVRNNLILLKGAYGTEG